MSFPFVSAYIRPGTSWITPCNNYPESYRYQARPPNHYATQLFEQGVKRIAQKGGEEGVEGALAAIGEDREEMVNGEADLLYHLFSIVYFKQETKRLAVCHEGSVCYEKEQSHDNRVLLSSQWFIATT